MTRTDIERSVAGTHLRAAGTHGRRLARVAAACLAASVALVPLVHPEDAPARAAARFAQSRSSTPLPLGFQPNQGQWPASVLFGGHWGPIFVAFTEGSVVMTVPAGREPAASEPPVPDSDPRHARPGRLAPRAKVRYTDLVMRFTGAHPASKAIGLDPLPGKTYYVRADPSEGPAPAVPRYGRVEYRGLYPNVDLVFYVNEGRLEYDIVVRPGGDPSVVDFEFDGMDGVALSPDGDLVLQAAGGRLRHRQPKAFAEVGAEREAVPAQFRLNGRRVSFEISRHDRRKKLRIDPVIEWETTLDVDELIDTGGVAADAEGNSYVTGTFYDPSFNRYRFFVSKFDASGLLVFHSVLPVSVWSANDIAVDATGAVYVVGRDGSGGFLAKLTPDGSALAFPSVQVSGNSLEQYSSALGVAVDVGGNAYVVGGTYDGDKRISSGAVVPGLFGSQSAMFPLPRPINNVLVDGDIGIDAFLLVVDANGLVRQRGLFGGAEPDRATAVAVDPFGAVYIVGWSESGDFPTTEDAFQFENADITPCIGGDYYCQTAGDAFLVKLTPGAWGLSYSTLIGGHWGDIAGSVAVDRSGSVYVAGKTTSPDFPAEPAGQPAPAVMQSAFLVKMNRRGSALRYSRAYAPPGTSLPGTLADASDVVVGGDGTSYWLVKSRVEGDGSCSLWLVTLSRNGELESEQPLGAGAGNGGACADMGGYSSGFNEGPSARMTSDGAGNVYVDVTWGWVPGGSSASLMRFDTGRALMRPDARCHGECVAANPAHRVSVVTGNAWLDQADGEGLDAGGLLPFTRSYNSQAAVEGMPGPLGPGWSHAFSRHLELVAGGAIRLVEDDGVPTLYGDPQRDGRYVPTAPVTDRSWIDRSPSGYTRLFPGGDSEEYDAYGRLTRVLQASGNSVTLERDAETEQVTTLTAGNGASLDLSYEDTPNEFRLTRVALGATILATYEYDENGYLTAVTRPGPETLRFRYDDAGQLLSATDGSKTVIAAFTYGGNYQAVRSDIAGGQERFTFSYGEGATSVINSQGWTTTYEWTDIQGMRAITRRTAPCEACEGGGSFVDTWTYTPEGRIKSHDAQGLLTSFTYNAHGDVETVIDPELRPTSYSYVYAEDGQALSQTRLSPGGATVQSTFGASGLASVTEAVSDTTSRSVSFGYSGGRLRSMTDPAGKVWQFERDGLGKLTAVMTPMQERRSYIYDPLGRVTSMTNAFGQTTKSTYDSAGRIARLERLDDSIVEFRYDSAGRLLKTIDPLGRTTGRSYDATGRLMGIRDAANGTTQFAYDSMSRLARLTDAEGRASRFEYFGDGSVKREISPGGAEAQYRYNPHGWLIQRIDRRGVTTTYDYDLVGRLKGKTYSDGTPGISFAYDVAGRLETATNGVDSLRWTYDLAGQLLTEASTRAGTTVTYTYGLRGNRLSLSLNGTLLGGYFYDDDGRMTGVSSGAGAFGLEYDAASRRRKLVHPNGVVTEYGYDDLSRLTSVAAHQPAATAVVSHAYTYDAAGNRTSKASPDLTEAYGYDAVDRLKSIARSGEEGTRVSSYDRVGNRLVTQAGGDVQGASYNARNQLTSISGGGTLLFRGTLDEPGVAAVNGQPARMVTDRVFEANVAVVPGSNTVTVEAWDASGNKKAEQFSVTQPASSATFLYDANGNLVEKTEGGHVFGFEWNAENELERITRDGAEVARFLYDPLGRRVQKVAGGLTYDYVYDGQDILKETHNDGTTYTYVHGTGIDEPLARMDQANVVAYYHADGLGSIIATTDAAGNVTSRRQYDAWGNLEQGADQPGYAFTGREWDPETGLYYYRARYYDPKIGRFISEDPIGFAGGANFYSYVSGQPTNFVDPLGLADSPHLVIYYGSMSPATAGVIAHRVAMGLMASDRIGTPTYELRPGDAGFLNMLLPRGLAGQILLELRDSHRGWPDISTKECGHNFAVSGDQVAVDTSEMAWRSKELGLEGAAERFITGVANVALHEIGHSYYGRAWHSTGHDLMLIGGASSDSWLFDSNLKWPTKP